MYCIVIVDVYTDGTAAVIFHADTGTAPIKKVRLGDTISSALIMSCLEEFHKKLNSTKSRTKVRNEYPSKINFDLQVTLSSLAKLVSNYCM